jgi:hypothetical protein
MESVLYAINYDILYIIFSTVSLFDRIHLLQTSHFIADIVSIMMKEYRLIQSAVQERYEFKWCLQPRPSHDMLLIYLRTALKTSYWALACEIFHIILPLCKSIKQYCCEYPKRVGFLCQAMVYMLRYLPFSLYKQEIEHIYYDRYIFRINKQAYMLNAIKKNPDYWIMYNSIKNTKGKLIWNEFDENLLLFAARNHNIELIIVILKYFPKLLEAAPYSHNNMKNNILVSLQFASSNDLECLTIYHMMNKINIPVCCGTTQLLNTLIQKGDLATLKYIWRTTSENIDTNKVYAMIKNACNHNKPLIADWLYHHIKYGNFKKECRTLCPRNIFRPFTAIDIWHLCAIGNISIIEWLFDVWDFTVLPKYKTNYDININKHIYSRSIMKWLTHHPPSSEEMCCKLPIIDVF